MFHNHSQRMSTVCAPCLDRWSVKRSSQGFSIVSAIFLLVVLAALGTFMVVFSTAQHTTSATDLEGSRAYWAARSGLDWGMYQALDPVARTTYACATTCAFATPPCTGAASAGAATNNVQMGGFTATVSCTCTPVCQAGTFTQVFTLVANACNQPSAGACPHVGVPTGSTYVERQVTSMVAF